MLCSGGTNDQLTWWHSLARSHGCLHRLIVADQAKKRLAAKKKAGGAKKGGSAALVAKAAAEAKARAAKKGKGKDKSSYNQVGAAGLLTLFHLLSRYASCCGAARRALHRILVRAHIVLQPGGSL